MTGFEFITAFCSLQESYFYFGSTKRQGTDVLQDSTLCVIKPHAIKDNLAGRIISSISDAGFKITALQMFHLEKANAEEFHEIYKGVLNEYSVCVPNFCYLSAMR